MTEQVRFRPRRLGHANLYVSDLERSMSFYIDVAGLEEVFREPAIHAGFVSNGNTHHDIGMVEVSDRRRIDEHVSSSDAPSSDPQGWGTRPGINHLAFEMENEAELVAAYRRARDAGIEFRMTVDHQLSRSVYLFDPDGNGVEFYADTTKDWRAVFEAYRDQVVTEPWTPGETPPTSESFYPVDPEIRRVEKACFHPMRITHVVLCASRFDETLGFYRDIGGLQDVVSRPSDGVALLRGTRPAHGFDLALFAAGPDRPAGLHHMSFEVQDASELDAAEARLSSLGVERVRSVDDATKRSVFVRDPDGLGIEFYARRDEAPGELGPYRV